MRTLKTVNSSEGSSDSTACTGDANGGDWQEEVFQKIIFMKDLYLLDLKDMHQRLLVSIQKKESLPQQPNNKLVENLKELKTTFESFIAFLQIPKHHILPNHKDELSTYEQRIVRVITTYRRISMIAQQQPPPPPQPLPPPLMHSVQQNMMNSMQPTSSIDRRQNSSMNGAHQVNINRMVSHNGIAPLISTAQMGNAYGGDWQEEVYQKIKVMKDLYLLDLIDMRQSLLVQIQLYHSLPQQSNNEQFEKLKELKTMVERFIAFLQIPKHHIFPNHKDELSTYEKCIVRLITTYRLISTTAQQQPPPQPQPLPPPHLHFVHQNMINSMQPTSSIDPRQNSSMNGVQQVNINHMVSHNASINSTVQMGNAYGGDWQEEVYQKIIVMRDLYLLDLKDMRQSLLVQIQLYHSLPPQSNSEQFEELKELKTMVERFIAFLQIPKHHILPNHKDKQSTYEKLIVHVITSHHRKPAATQQPPPPPPPPPQPQPLPPPHLHSVHQNMMNNTMQPTSSIDPRQISSMNGDQQVNINHMVSHNASLYSTAQMGNANGGDWQDEVYQKLEAMKDLYLLDLIDIHQKILGKIEEYYALPLQQFTAKRNDELEKLDNILAEYKDLLSTYNKKIVHVITSFRQRPTTAQQQPPPPPQPHPQS